MLYCVWTASGPAGKTPAQVVSSACPPDRHCSSHHPLAHFGLAPLSCCLHLCVCMCQSLSHVQLCHPTNCTPPVSSVRGIVQEIVAISSSRGSSQPRDRTQVSCIAGRFFTVWATREAWVSALSGPLFQEPITLVWSSKFISVLEALAWKCYLII